MRPDPSSVAGLSVPYAPRGPPELCAPPAGLFLAAPGPHALPPDARGRLAAGTPSAAPAPRRIAGDRDPGRHGPRHHAADGAHPAGAMETPGRVRAPRPSHASSPLRKGLADSSAAGPFPASSGWGAVVSRPRGRPAPGRRADPGAVQHDHVEIGAAARAHAELAPESQAKPWARPRSPRRRRRAPRPPPPPRPGHCTGAVPAAGRHYAPPPQAYYASAARRGQPGQRLVAVVTLPAAARRGGRVPPRRRDRSAPPAGTGRSAPG